MTPMWQSFSLSPTKLGDRYRLDELTFADTAATGGNAPKADLPRRLRCHSRAGSAWRSNLTLWDGSALVPDPSRPMPSLANYLPHQLPDVVLLGQPVSEIDHRLIDINHCGRLERQRAGADGLSPEHEQEVRWPSSAGCAVAPRGASSGERSTAATRANSLRHPADLFGALPAAPGSTEYREPQLCLSV